MAVSSTRKIIPASEAANLDDPRLIRLDRMERHIAMRVPLRISLEELIRVFHPFRALPRVEPIPVLRPSLALRQEELIRVFHPFRALPRVATKVTGDKLNR